MMPPVRAFAHERAEVVSHLALADDGEGDHRAVDLRLELDEIAADLVRAGVVDQKADFHIVGRSPHAIDRVRCPHVERHGTNLGPA